MKSVSFRREKYQRNWVFVTYSDFPISISLQHNVGDLRNFKLRSINNSMKYQRFTPSVSEFNEFEPRL